MNKRIQFAPFHAINEFMLPVYRQSVLQTVLGNLDQLPPGRRSAIVGLIKSSVKIPGFRNPTVAPLPLKVKGAVSAFEKNPQFTAQILSGWAELNPELRQQVHDLLKERGWEVLPPEADRSRMPGFRITWPQGEDYDQLDEAYAAAHPGVEFSRDDLRLMAVWVGNRLPFTHDEGEESSEGAAE